jgi:hypothetical protein
MKPIVFTSGVARQARVALLFVGARHGGGTPPLPDPAGYGTSDRAGKALAMRGTHG